MTKPTHIGRKISRLRELKEMKQETLAEALGISQQAVSKIEQSETVEELTLERISKVLGFSPEAIKSYNDEAVINNIQTNYDNGSGPYNNCQFHNDKVVELIEENKKLLDEVKSLYIALLKEKDEKIALLNKMLGDKQ
jgi:transcriptional regulator with XRE-family HTH domain